MSKIWNLDWRWLQLVLVYCAVVTSLVACAAIDTVSGDSSGGSDHIGDCSGAGCGAVAPGTGASNGLSLFVEPSAGETPILREIESAQSSIWLEIYLLTDSNVIHALEDAANRGIDVRVLLELNPAGGGSISAQETLQKLQVAGIKAEGSDSAYYYTHEKAMILDGATVLIMTANLTKSALGGSSAATNREYGVIDTNVADVKEAADIFVADWQRTAPTLTDPNLVISPINARVRLSGFITSASSTLLVQDEEMYDIGSENALIAAAKRGVNVEVILPAPSGSSGSTSDVSRLLAGGVHVRYDDVLYMHAKMMVADGAYAFVGSENFSSTSLDKNRELGILITNKSVITTLSVTFQQDWSDSQAAN